MPRLLVYCLSTVALFVALLIYGSGTSLTATRLSAEDDAADNEANAAYEKSAREALDDAVATLESGDLRKFIEYYAPVDQFRQMRDRGTLKQIAPAALPLAGQRWLEHFKRFQGGEVVIDKDGYVAQWTPKPQVASKDEKAGSEKSGSVLKVPSPKDDKITLVGYGDDLPNVARAGVAALERGKLDDFVDSLFPAGELGRLKSNGGKAKLIAQLKSQPQAVERMIAELKAIQDTPFEVSDDGTIATVVLPAPMVEQGAKQHPNIKPRERTIKFQKVSGSWRFFDNSTGFREEIARQSQLAPPKLDFQNSTNRRSAARNALLMERYGSSWRFVALPEF